MSKWAPSRMAFLVMVAGCTQVTEVSTVDLAQVVGRDAVPFVAQSVPEAVVDRLSAARVVIVGETHLIREHREMMVELVQSLHARGFRQLLMEFPHLADWMLVDFVEDGPLQVDWEPPEWIGGDMIAAIRDFNRTLPPDEHVGVRGIDVNLQDYGGATDFLGSFGRLSQYLESPGPVAAFLQGGYATSETQIVQLETLRDALIADRSELVAAWGVYLYDTVAEMVEVELASVPIRAVREDRYDQSARLRENVMKRLADLRLEGVEYGTVVNVGGNHAQKAFLKGTDQEWLGDYLVHRSTAVGGSAMVLAVKLARITAPSGGAITDNLEGSPENELFRVMDASWPGQDVFLPLDDAVFVSEGVLMNFEGTIYTGAPKRHYDAFVLFTMGHRVPLP